VGGTIGGVAGPLLLDPTMVIAQPDRDYGFTKERDMSRVISAHAVSVDGYISGRTPEGEEEFGRGLGDAPMLFDWYFDGDTPSRLFKVFKLSGQSARFFDAIAGRVGAAISGRTTYEHSSHWGGGSPHPTAPLVVLSHRPEPEISDKQTLVTSGIEDAIAAARAVADDKDIALMGGGLVTEALKARLVDELVLHQVPILLGAGRSFFQELPEHVRLRPLETIPAPGVTHLHDEVVR
jgi:dihydrofolate reductase